ncbi:BTB/POZ domain-containing protein 7 isoform X4 [Bicyclus anynana]|uniref:BTB/POZ domain-containing protein 7 isoform X4 n=1 Tax=Bicyclus anynana TaxID=110368 RepID=A0ABM3M3M3_BICAN|nr:BTB/POZ domain-containing protein 7 isoform X4 [Bicyclus anynana]
MSRLLCCLRARRSDMGAALSHPQEGDACDGGLPASPPTMADVIRERKKKAGGAALGTLRRRLAAAARRPRDSRPDRGCEHARFIRSVVSSWRLAEVFLLCEELEAGAALRDLATQAELAREPAPALHADLAALYRDRWWCDVEVAGGGWALPAHRVILAARCTYFRDLLQRYPNCVRVPLEGAGGSLSRAEADAVLLTLYAGSAAPRLATCDSCAGWDRGMNTEADLDIISVENSTMRRCSCGAGSRVDGARLRRLADALGFCADALHRDLRYLLDSGELCDARLSWAEGATVSSYGFRSALELPCHRLLLAARSRFFRSVMSRRGGAGGAGGAVFVDEKVLPRRFARALLHAAYTDQVDLSLISRSSSSPSSSTSAGSTGTLRGSVSRGSPAAMLDDAFQLYEIARFLEMPIVAQGCEDAAARALSADTLPRVLRWACAPHASAWLHRQAMRFLRDEFPAIMSSAAAARLPRAPLAAALASPFLQASEAQALRGVLRWAERAAQPPHAAEPNVVWHTTQSARRAARARGRRAPADAALRETVAALVPLLRLEHLPPDCDVLQQAIRRGIITAPPHLEQGSSADAWLGRGAFRSPRCFLPYLDEIKALLEEQAVPEAELARARRQRYAHRIPDTLYMVAAAKCAHAAPSDADGEAVSTEGVRACVSARVLAALRARVAELRASPPAARALLLHAADPRTVRRQIALRAVRERSLPDACAELLLAERDTPDDREGEEWERRGGAHSAARSDLDDDCCRSGSGSLRCASGSVSTQASMESARAAGGRQLPQRPQDAPHRSGSFGRGGRLSAAVPDVAMAPNANTHLLTARDYPQPHAPHPHPHALAPHPHARTHHRPPELGAVLQLDLGDGATHTPRPGSRALRAHGGRQREAAAGMSCVRRADDDELRAAIELSVIRAYSSLQVARRGAAHVADLLPPPDFAVHRSRATPSPSAPAAAAPARRRERPHLSTAGGAERRACAAPGSSGSGAPGGSVGPVASMGPVGPLGALSAGPAGAGGARGSASRSPSPRRSPYPLYTLYAHRDYRSGSEPRSRAHSPAYA